MKMPDTTPLRPLAFQRENRDIHLALMRGSQAYLAERGDHRFADRGMFAKVLLLILVQVLQMVGDRLVVHFSRK